MDVAWWPRVFMITYISGLTSQMLPKMLHFFVFTNYRGITPQATQVQKTHFFYHIPPSISGNLQDMLKCSTNLSWLLLFVEPVICLQTAICSSAGHSFPRWDDFTQVAAATLHVLGAASSPAHEVTGITVCLGPAALHGAAMVPEV